MVQQAFAVAARVEGVPEVMRALKKLDTGIRRRVLFQAASAASRPVLKAVERKLMKHRRSGQYARALRRKIRYYDKTATVVAMVGAARRMKIFWKRPGRKKPIPVDPTMYSHLLEDAVRPHATGKGSKLLRKDHRDRAAQGIQRAKDSLLRSVFRGDSISRIASKQRSLDRAKARLGRQAKQKGGMHPGYRAFRIIRSSAEQTKGQSAAIFRQKVTEGLAREAAKARSGA